MGRNMTRRTLAKAAIAALAMASLGGCSPTAKTTAGSGSSGASAAVTKDNPLTVYLWDTDLITDLSPYLHEQMPNTRVQFIAGNNDLDLYSYLLEHGELPDIITVRRFAGSEAKDLRPHLMDFSFYDVVSSFTSSSLRYYKNADSAINWLPVCGIPQTIIANKTLFDAFGLALPQTYKEYAAACQTFSSAGIKPYALDLAEDWSSHEMVQAGGIGELMSLAGIAWRAQAESAEGDIAFDETLWRNIISQTATLLKDSGFTADDLSLGTDAAMRLFVEGKAAMFHGSPVHLKQCQGQMSAQLVRLPYFSQISDEGYVYMTPSLHIAMNRNLENNPDRLDAAIGVLEHMLSSEGQKLIANGGSVISFNTGVESLTDGMVGLEDEMARRQYYIRYSSQKSFDASVKVVKGLLTQTMNEEQALEAFKVVINSADAQAELFANFDNDYALSLNKAGGRDAASSILSTVREGVSAQLALAPYYYFASPIYQGECTKNRVNLMVASKPNPASLYRATLTGAALRTLVEGNLSGADGDFRPASIWELPVASGMKLVVRANGGHFSLENLLVDGSPIGANEEYDVLLTDGVVASFGSALKPLADATLSTAWIQAIASGRGLADPQDYIEVRE